MVAGLHARWHESLDDIATAAWDELASAVPGGTPFLRHAFMRAMVHSGSACAKTGWRPCFVTVHGSDGRLVGASPVFLKSHSYGEYVFDWAWADAHDRALARHGLRYYPKLLSAVPFSPIPGQRLLTHPSLDAASRRAVQEALLAALHQRCEDKGWSSAHALFVSEEEAGVAAAQGWLVRHGVQFHWQNRAPDPYASFEDFLGGLHREKRKKIQQERRKVQEAGVAFDVLQGAQIGEDDWDFFYRCYCQTYLERGQEPYLTRLFWREVAAALPDCWVLFVARQGSTRVACALLAIDPQRRVAYGRYWGALANVSCLHFDACYYQPLEWCIAQSYARFEGGAQGEHKLHRGLLPVRTQSVHWLQHPGLREAVANFLMQEDDGVSSYMSELDERSPFKPQDQGH